MRNRMGRLEVGGLLAVLLSAGVWVGLSAASRDGAAPERPGGGLQKARVNGKYRMLLRQFKVEKDAETNGELQRLAATAIRRNTAAADDLPAGHWVYVGPLLVHLAQPVGGAASRPKHNWGPEQATGEPDTNMAGNIVTAWASASQEQARKRWLMLQ